MILLISSDAARRYSDDIVRALAHPNGTDFQFRYDLAYLEPALQDQAKQKKLTGKALIAFLAADKATASTRLTSVRCVTIKRNEVVGSSCILTLTAGDYLHPLDDTAIRAGLTREVLSLLPAWDGGERPKGSFAITLATDISVGHVAKLGEDMQAFEETAIALSKFAPFSPTTSMAFFAVRGIVALDPPPTGLFTPNPAPSFEGDRFLLKSGIRYRFDIYTYRPAGSAPGLPAAKLMVSSDEKAMQFTSIKEAVLDSRYDLNRFSFTTDQLLNAVPAAIRVALAVTSGAPPATEQRYDITLHVLFRGWGRKAIARTLLIAGGTAWSAIIGVWLKDEFSLGVALLMCVGPLVAAWAATFPLLRKWS